MAIAYHVHDFLIPTATNEEASNGTVSNKALVPSNLPPILSTKQDLSTALTSIAGLSTSANQMIYTTAENAYATTALTSIGRDVIGGSSAEVILGILGGGTTGIDVFQADTAAAIRALLDLEPGTDVQAQSAILQSLADETLATGDLLYASAANTVANLPIGTEGQRLTVVSGVPDWVTIPDAVFTPETYGAVADGVTDDATAIQDAVDAAASNGGGIVRFQDGATYKANSTVSVASDNIRLEGKATLDFSDLPAGTALNDAKGIDVLGTIGSTVSVTANLTEGAKQITVSSTTGFAVGDIILLASANGEFPYGQVGGANRVGAMHRIRSINSATQLTIFDGTFFDFDTADTVTIAKITPVRGFTAENLNLVMGGVSSVHNGVRLRYAVRPYLRNVSVDGAEDCGVRTAYVFGGGIEGGDIQNCTSPLDGGSGVTGVTGYGVLPGDGVRNFFVRETNFRNCRHSVAGGGVHPSIFVNIIGNNIDGSRTSPATNYDLDCHEDCLYWTFADNNIAGSIDSAGSGGILVRGQGTTVINNRISNSFQYGIQVKCFDTNPNGLKGVQIIGNIIDGARLSPIYLDGDASVPITDFVISGNRITGTSGNNTGPIFCEFATRGVISNNIVSEPLGTNIHGVRLISCNLVSITNNAMTGTGVGSSSAGARLESCNDITVVGNTFSGFYRPVYATGTTNYILVNGNNGRNCSIATDVSAAANNVVANNL